MANRMTDDEMIKKIEELFPYLSRSTGENISMIESGINCSWIGEDNQTLLHVLFDKIYHNEDRCTLFAAALLSLKVDPNAISNIYGGTFIHTAIFSGYSTLTIQTLISIACKRGFNINIQNRYGNTILHSLIMDSDFSGKSILKLYDLARKNGFNPNILNGDGFSILELFEASISTSDNRTSSELRQLKENIEIDNENELKKRYASYEKFGRIMNFSDFETSPTVGREQEVEKLGIALCQKNKSAILIGESGVGKTSIVEQLAYNIKNGYVPSVLKNKIILEISPSELVAGKKYVGDFEETIKELVEMCIENDIILFIDEIHTLFGTGSHSNSDVDMAQMLKRYLGRTPLKIIGTTTELEYNKYFYSDALKRRFSVIEVNELDRDRLKCVIEKELIDLGVEYLISPERMLETNLCDVLLDLTQSKNLLFGETARNPDLVIGVIRSAYAKALYDECTELDETHIKYGIDECTHLKELAKEEAVDSLELLEKKNQNQKQKKKIIPFNIGMKI